MPPSSRLGRGLPEAVPLSVIQGMVARVLGPQLLDPTPVPATDNGPRPLGAPGGQTVPGQGAAPPGSPLNAPPSQPGNQPAGPGPPPGGPPPGPLPPNPSASPPGGPPLPGEPDSGEGEGLNPDQQSMLMQLLADPRAQRDVQKILDQLGGRAAKTTPLEVISPAEADRLAEYINSAIEDLTGNLTQQRGLVPGANQADDEQLLIVYYTTPSNLTLDDIPAYANTVRMYLVGQGWTDTDDIEDQVTQECFPLRLSLIRNGRQKWQDQVDFVQSMNALSDRWITKHGELPQADPMVQLATEIGKGNPEGQYADRTSEAVVPGDKAR